MKLLFQVLASCVLLGGSTLLQQYGADVAAMFLNYWGNVSEKGMLVTLPVADLMLLVQPEPAAQLLQQPLAKLLSLLLGKWAHAG